MNTCKEWDPQDLQDIGNYNAVCVCVCVCVCLCDSTGRKDRGTKDCLFVCVCLSVCLFLSLSLCLSVCLSVSVSLSPLSLSHSHDVIARNVHVKIELLIQSQT